MDRVRIGRKRRPEAVAADKACDVPRIRQRCGQRGIRAVIPEKRKAKRKRGRPVKLDREAYRRRNVVERCIGGLKYSRRFATRHEKPVIHYLAMAQPAMVQRWLRLFGEPSNTT